MVTRYGNLSGVDANYIDGSFASLSQVAGAQSIMLMGTAKKGLSNIPYLVEDLGAVSAEFGNDSQVAVLASQISNTQDANIFVTRIGGKQSHFLLEKGITGSSERETLLRISPTERGDSAVFDDMKVALLPYKVDNIIRQRVIIFNADTEVVLFDSEEILSTDDTLFEVEIGNSIGEILISDSESYTLPTTTEEVEADSSKDPRSLVKVSELPSLSSLITASSLSAVNTLEIVRYEDVYAATLTNSITNATILNVGSLAGESKDSMTHCERFAAIEVAYADLEDAGVDFMYCDGCYADVKTIPASGLKSAEMARWDDLYLGTGHKSVVAGKPYLTMFASPDPLNSNHVEATGATISHGGQSVKIIPHAESLSLGLLLTLNDIRFETSTASTLQKEEYFDVDGRLKTVISSSDFNQGATLSCGMFSVKIVNPAPLAGGTLSTFINAEEIDLRKLFVLNGDDAGDHSVKKAVLTHFQLTGEFVPDEVYDSLIEEVSGKYQLSDKAYAKKLNFAHQAASMAYTSSTEYKSTIAVVPTTRPRGGLRQLARWAGKAPEYTINSNGDLVVSKDGTGFMGTEVLYGSANFRPTASGIGAAYGGLIKNTDDFGIDSDKEETDSRNFPIDLGKHLLVVGAYGVVSIQNSGRTPGFAISNLGPKIIQKLVELPVNEEPIGPVNGVLDGVSTTGAINSRALLNDLALGRVIMIGSDGSIANIRTAALPGSDYTRVSTIRAANLVLDAARNVSLKYLGRAFSDAQLAALDAELAGTMRSLKVDGSIQDGTIRTSASRLDRINGRLNLKVTFVPPLSIEAITIDLTVSAPQA